MKYSVSEFKDEINGCIDICLAEIANREKGIEGESTIEQIQTVLLPELYELSEKIKTGNLPPPKDRYLVSFAYAFKVWGWNMNHPTSLYIKLVNLNDHYKLI